MLYVFYITTTPYLPCNNKNINRKELYDFYYTAITLTTGYKYMYTMYVENIQNRIYVLHFIPVVSFARQLQGTAAPVKPCLCAVYL